MAPRMSGEDSKQIGGARRRRKEREGISHGNSENIEIHTKNIPEQVKYRVPSTGHMFLIPQIMTS